MRLFVVVQDDEIIVTSETGFRAAYCKRPNHPQLKVRRRTESSRNGNSIDLARFGNDDFVAATGSLTGEGVRHKNNAIQVSCYKPEARCLVFQIEQIDDNLTPLLADIYPPLVFPISQWGPALVVATTSEDSLSGYPSGCIKSTLNLARERSAKFSEDKVSAEFVEEPINLADMNCQNTPNVVRKWTLEDPAFWKR